MSIVVIKPFTDLQDNRHAYKVGDEFPRPGLPVSEERLLELSTENNKRGCALIKISNDEKPVNSVKPTKKRGKKNDSVK